MFVRLYSMKSGDQYDSSVRFLRDWRLVVFDPTRDLFLLALRSVGYTSGLEGPTIKKVTRKDSRGPWMAAPG